MRITCINPTKTRLENAVHNLAANSGTGAEDGSVTQLLAKLLAALLKLARFLGRAVCRVGNVQGRVPVVAHRDRRSSRYDGLLLTANIAGWEDALLAGALVASLPPLVVHVLSDYNLVVRHEGQIASVLGVVLVHGRGMAEGGGRSGRSRRHRVGRRGRVHVVGVVAHIARLLLRLRSRRLDAQARHLLHRDGGEGARIGIGIGTGVGIGIAIGIGGELIDNGVVLLLRDDIRVDEELKLLRCDMLERRQATRAQLREQPIPSRVGDLPS
jgi:hypothetical protein